MTLQYAFTLAFSPLNTKAVLGPHTDCAALAFGILAASDQVSLIQKSHSFQCEFYIHISPQRKAPQ